MLLKRCGFRKLGHSGYSGQAGQVSEWSSVFWVSKANGVWFLHCLPYLNASDKQHGKIQCVKFCLSSEIWNKNALRWLLGVAEKLLCVAGVRVASSLAGIEMIIKIAITCQISPPVLCLTQRSPEMRIRAVKQSSARAVPREPGLELFSATSVPDESTAAYGPAASQKVLSLSFLVLVVGEIGNKLSL